MSNVINTFQKTAVERRRLYIDYSCWLEDEEVLTDLQVTTYPATEPALQVTTGYPDLTHKKLQVFVGGGVAATNYKLSFVVRTNEGQTREDNIGMRVTT